jgi:hypothetical protein
MTLEQLSVPPITGASSAISVARMSVGRSSTKLERVIASLPPSSATLTNTDAARGPGKSARDGDAGYDPVVEVDELEKILGLSRPDREDRDLEAKRGLIWGLVATGIAHAHWDYSIPSPGEGTSSLPVLFESESLGDVRSSRYLPP